MSTLVLYNPHSGGKKDVLPSLMPYIGDGDYRAVDITAESDAAALISSLGEGDRVILCGGDGSLSRFASDTYGRLGAAEVLLYATGSGNDFLRDIGQAEGTGPVSVKRYLQNLPLIRVDGREYRFINGVGFGLDGYCCDAVNRKKRKGSLSYLKVALKGLLWDFKPTRATVEVDGEVFEYEKVWLAPTMLGKFFGGGFKAAPLQDREREDGKLSLVMMHSAGRLKCLRVFPKVLKGTHLSHGEMITVHEGYDIKVTFDKAVALQIDGETVPPVTEYVCHSDRRGSSPAF